MSAAETTFNDTTLSGATKIRNTKAALLEAFYRLYKHTDIDEITVSALCREAGVNRTTFYKYYSIPSDVLLEKYTEVLKESTSFAFGSSSSIYENMLKLCCICYENRKSMELYFRASGDLMPLLSRSLSLFVDSADFMKKPENHFIAGGVCGIVVYWLQHDFKEPPEEIARLLTKCIDAIGDSFD